MVWRCRWQRRARSSFQCIDHNEWMTASCSSASGSRPPMLRMCRYDWHQSLDGRHNQPWQALTPLIAIISDRVTRANQWLGGWLTTNLLANSVRPQLAGGWNQIATIILERSFNRLSDQLCGFWISSDLLLLSFKHTRNKGSVQTLFDLATRLIEVRVTSNRVLWHGAHKSCSQPEACYVTNLINYAK